MLSITLPAGAAPGTIVQAPDGSGGTVQVQLPHGCAPGATVQVPLPAAPAALVAPVAPVARASARGNRLDGGAARRAGCVRRHGRGR